MPHVQTVCWTARKLLSASLGVAALSYMALPASCGGSTDLKPAGGSQDASDERLVGNLPPPAADAQQHDEGLQDGASEESSVAPGDGSSAARAFVLATFGAARDANNNNLCNFNSARAVFAIGTAFPSPATAADGDVQMGAAVVHVVCSVIGGFDVNLNASLGGVQGGSLTVVGHVDVTSGGQGVHATLNVPNADGVLSEDNCIVVFTYLGNPVPSPAVVPGRIWAHLSCPRMVNTSGVLVHLMDGSTVAETCDGEADFVFENCTTG